MITFKNGTAEKVVDFIPNPPPIPPNENIFHFAHWGDEGISYSDPITGEMKFIISRRLGFGKDFKDFPNDTILKVCPGNKKSYQIIPIPDNPGKFYVMQFQSIASDLVASEFGLQVRCPNAIGLGYSIVDLSKNNGLGDFVSMNNVIRNGLTEQITYVRHSNGKDVWIICHPYNTAEYYAILATATGFNQPIISNIGPIISGGSRSVYGTLEASHDGKLLVGTRSIPLTAGRQYSEIEFFNFDNATGLLTNYRTIPADGFTGPIQFSPDNSKLYAISNPDGYTFQNIIQWDFNAPDLAASKTELYNSKYGGLIDMQLAPDGKIYISRYYEVINDDFIDYLMVIQCPNLPQYASNFKLRGIKMAFNNFPDFINDFINVPKIIPLPKFSIGNDTAMCFGTKHTLTAPTGWESYKWNTGETTLEITIDKPGLYYVLTGNTGFSCPSGYGYINIADKAIKLNLGKDTSLCANTSFPLRIPNGYTNILWNNGSSTRDSLLFGGGEIIISANDAFGCFTNDTINVNMKYYPRANFGKDTVLCNNEKLILSLEPTNIFGGNAIYKWNNNSSTEQFIVTQPGIYWGSVSFEGCTVSDTIRVGYINTDQKTLGNDTTLCFGDSLLLSPLIEGANYLWNTGATTQSIYAKTSGEYWVNVNNGTCILRDTIQVTFTAKPVFTLGKDTVLCQGELLVLNPGISGGNFLWQDGSRNEQLTVRTAGQYWLSFTRSGCTVRDTIQVVYNGLPLVNLGKDTSICAGSSITINAFNPLIKSYLWQNQDNTPTFTTTLPGTYHVKVTGLNGCNNYDTISIAAIPLPVFTLGKDTSLCEGNTITLSYNLSGAEYLWSNGSRNHSNAISTTGTYWLKSTRQGCSYSDTIKVNFKPIPKIHLGNDTTLCEGNSIILNAAYPNTSFTWQDGSKLSTFPVKQQGLYHVMADLDNCIFKDSIKILYKPKPTLQIVTDTVLCAGQSIMLTPITNSAVEYYWQNGSRTPTFQVTDSGKYSIVITNECGSANQNITVNRGVCRLFLPTAFTPNNDNLNDVFRIKYPFETRQYKMRIYNRFGNLVFETNNMSKDWDGSFNGKMVPSGNYVWDVSYVDLDGKVNTGKGSVMLIR